MSILLNYTDDELQLMKYSATEYLKNDSITKEEYDNCVMIIAKIDYHYQLVSLLSKSSEHETDKSILVHGKS